MSIKGQVKWNVDVISNEEARFYIPLTSPSSFWTLNCAEMVVISQRVYFLNFDDESWACDWITQHHRYVPWHMNFLFAYLFDYQWCSSCKSNLKENRSGCLSDVKASIKSPSSAAPRQHLKLSAPSLSNIETSLLSTSIYTLVIAYFFTMRLSIICALFVGAVIAIPHGAQEVSLIQSYVQPTAYWQIFFS